MIKSRANYKRVVLECQKVAFGQNKLTRGIKIRQLKGMTRHFGSPLSYP